MFPEQRKARILELVQRHRAVRVSELGGQLGVSEASVRRDLQDLEERGLLKRTHGGAVSHDAAAFEPSLAEKQDQHGEAKVAIARVAAGLVEEGETVVLDAGSTTLQIARQLKGRRNITVVTNGLNVAWELASSPVELVLIGGTLRAGTLSLVGPLAESALSRLRVDRLFLGVNGLDLKNGLTTPNVIEAETKKAMLESAKEAIAVADASKFGRVAFCRICGVERLHVVITDSAVPAPALRGLEERGVRVLVASNEAGAEPGQSQRRSG
jgi:DeoR family fructose operon transcriptional repressor